MHSPVHVCCVSAWLICIPNEWQKKTCRHGRHQERLQRAQRPCRLWRFICTEGGGRKGAGDAHGRRGVESAAGTLEELVRKEPRPAARKQGHHFLRLAV